ncbi:MAG: molybdate ABC transporter substrate-binding protein [Methanothrix sp.]|jgi:molybdate transport system substrate-binding protein|uniref:molybdate ABC transporter substrate-binding protein n=1 Tax=Methanothrix sp. TaxID=90426 RepID=UPI0025D64634|nr:molybdate ABC transporter substrate-binding protein [Methanothrix sp.]HPW72842.1 molybdate ABC transporter substrate-binding protein [Methanothrix sp.]
MTTNRAISYPMAVLLPATLAGLAEERRELADFIDGPPALRIQIENGACTELFAPVNNKQMNAQKSSGLITRRSGVSLFLALIALLSCACAEEQKDLVVFCGAGLTGAFSEIGEIYESRSNSSIAFNFDGVPALRAQIEQGAYADVLVSANLKHMNALKAEGYMDNSTVQIFAGNKMAVIVPNYNPANITVLSDLMEPGLKILIGTSDLPAGDYARQVLNKMADDPKYGSAYRDAVLANVVSEETTVNRIVSKIALGEADAGFAFISDVSPKMRGQVTRIAVPDEYNVLGLFPLGMLNQSRRPEEARRFIDLVMAQEGQNILKNYGFIPLNELQESKRA